MSGVDDFVKIATILSPIILSILAYLTVIQNTKLARVEKQTDGLATALATATGQVERAAGIKEVKDELAITAAEATRQQAMIEAIVARLTAVQVPHLVRSNGDPMPPPAPVMLDPGPVVARELSKIKATVEDTLPRVVNIEEAVVKTDATVAEEATKTDERLSRLEGA